MGELVKAFAKVGSAQLLAAVLALFANKTLAALVGPAGVGLFSVLRELQRSVSLVGTFGNSQPIIQGIAARQGADRVRFSAEVLKLQSVAAVVLAIALVALSPLIAGAVFGSATPDRAPLIAGMAIAIVCSILFGFVTGVMNGTMQIAGFAVCQIALATALLAGSYPLGHIAADGQELAYLWLLVTPFLFASVIGIGWLRLAGAFKGFAAALKESMRWDEVRSFGKTAAAMLITQVAASLGVLVIRSALVRAHGLGPAGQFDASWQVSMVYLNGILGALNVYFFPKLSATRSADAAVSLLWNVVRIAAFLVLCFAVALQLNRQLVVRELYTPQFTAAEQAMRWMLIGDYIRSASLFLSYFIVGEHLRRVYVRFELLWSLSFVGIALLAMRSENPLALVGAAYAAAYGFHLLLYLGYLGLKRGIRPPSRVAIGWLFGLACVYVAGFDTFAGGRLGQLAILTPLFLGSATLVLGFGRRRVSTAGSEPSLVPPTQ